MDGLPLLRLSAAGRARSNDTGYCADADAMKKDGTMPEAG